MAKRRKIDPRGRASGCTASSWNLTMTAEPVAIDRVLETVLYVDDLDQAERFYGDVLGLQLDSRHAGLFAFFRCGDGMLLLFEPNAAATGRNVPAHGAKGPGHVCFALPEDSLGAWRERLIEAGVSIEQEVRWPRGGRSFYFRDPAGNSLEMATPRIWGLREAGQDETALGSSSRLP